MPSPPPRAPSPWAVWTPPPPAIISVSHSESRALGPREKRRGSDKAALYCDLLEFSEKRRSDARLRSPSLLLPIATHFLCDLFHELRFQLGQNAVYDARNSSRFCFRVTRTWSGRMLALCFRLGGRGLRGLIRRFQLGGGNVGDLRRNLRPDNRLPNLFPVLPGRGKFSFAMFFTFFHLRRIRYDSRIRYHRRSCPTGRGSSRICGCFICFWD